MKGTKERKRVHLPDGSTWTYVIERQSGAYADSFVVRIYSPSGEIFRPTEGQLRSVLELGRVSGNSSFAPSVVKRYIERRILNGPTG